jgi:hypothetical protein
MLEITDLAENSYFSSSEAQQLDVNEPDERAESSKDLTTKK